MIKTSTEPPVVQTRLQRWAQSVADRIERWPVVARRALTIGTIAFCTLVGLLIVTAPFDFYAQCIFALGCFGAALLCAGAALAAACEALDAPPPQAARAGREAIATQATHSASQTPSPRRPGRCASHRGVQCRL